MKLGRDVSRHDVLDNWRNTQRYESVIAIIWLFWTISETDPGLWDRLKCHFLCQASFRLFQELAGRDGLPGPLQPG